MNGFWNDEGGGDGGDGGGDHDEWLFVSAVPPLYTMCI